MKNQHLLLIEALTDAIVTKYQQAKPDRTIIHRQEWDMDPHAFSIFFQAQLASIYYAGLASQIRGSSKIREKDLSEFDLHRISEDRQVRAWLETHRQSLPLFSEYLGLIEAHRIVIKDWIAATDNGKKLLN